MSGLLRLMLIAVSLSGSPQSKDTGAVVSRVARESPSPYCGLHCVHAGAQVLDRPFSFEVLVQAKYLTARTGSTVSDLCAAMRDVGLYPAAYGHFTVDHLRLVDRPVILHVRPPGQTAFRHWLLFLGWEGDGRIRIYDPPREAGSVDVAELLSIWDGIAIVISRADAEMPSTAFSLPFSITSVALVLVAVFCLQIAAKSLCGWKLIFAVAGIMSLFGQLALPSAFWRSPSAVANVTAAYFKDPVTHIDFETLNERLGFSDYYVVDARLPNAYEHYHLPNAVNIPVNAGYLRLRREIAAIGQQIVIVYCQGKECRWADAVARQLSARGVRDVRVYEGGVNEWREKAGSQ